MTLSTRVEQAGTWAQFLETGEVPDFPERGLYNQWDSQWNHTGYAEAQHHKGQPPVRFPPDWSPIQCFLASAALKARGL